jgi:hypothetical protein
MITLKSDRLTVELPEPGEAPNTSQRFDRAGFISEVTLDGTMRFCASEPRNLRHPSSGGRGLCNEYRFNICEDVAIGEYFPKFGIGLYRKEEEGKYVFFKKYQDVIPFQIHVQHTASSALFVTEPMPCQDCALRTTKTIALSGNTLTMTIKAENVGGRDLDLEEFCHNFISIDGMAIGSDYQLDLPQCADLGSERLRNRSGDRPGSLRGNGKGITFCEYSAVDTDYAVDPDLVEDKAPFTWKLIHKGAHASVQCEEGYRPAKVVVWAVDHIVSPEIIHGFHLRSGETHEWTRVWTFDTF